MRLRLILQSSPGNRVGTVELIEGGALQAGEGGEGEGQHRRQKNEQFWWKSQSLPGSFDAADKSGLSEAERF